MKPTKIYDLDYSKVKARPDTANPGKYIVDLRPAGVRLNYSILANDEEEALAKVKELLQKQFERKGHTLNEGIN